MSMASSSSSMSTMIRTGFGLTVGGLLASMIFIVIAMAFFIPGFILVKKEQKKPKSERNGTTLVVGYVLMGLGMIIGVGFGSGTFFSSLSGDV